MLRHKTGKQLEELAKLQDMKWATAHFMSIYKYTSGQGWSFWLEDDPRFEDGINNVSGYKCIKSGAEDSEWMEIQRA